jgi:hypothetical protein
MSKCFVLVAALFLIPATTSAYSYSITNIENYSWLSDLSPDGTEIANKVQYWLGTETGWTEEFYHKDSAVNKEDFGSSNSGYQGLDESDFHWHIGHGLWDNMDIALSDYSPWNPWATVDSGDVWGKWDLNNEWVVFQSCYVLGDPFWGAALKYSHMLLGFQTISYADSNLPEKFFEYAIDYDWPVLDAYKKATILTFGSDVEATAFVDTQEQLNDHLWGQGYVAPDEYPDDSSAYYYHWNCE